MALNLYGLLVANKFNSTHVLLKHRQVVNGSALQLQAAASGLP
jgi:hypothetical protein